jgi:hypothetical protein
MDENVIITAVLVAVICGVCPVREDDFEATCEYWVSKLPKGEFGRLYQFMPGEVRESDPQFWAALDGVHGVWDRLYTSHVGLRIIHESRRRKLIRRDDAAFLWRLIFTQIGYSLLALPEALVSSNKHIGASKALQCYLEIRALTATMCSVTNAPKCLLTLSELL